MEGAPNFSNLIFSVLSLDSKFVCLLSSLNGSGDLAPVSLKCSGLSGSTYRLLEGKLELLQFHFFHFRLNPMKLNPSILFVLSSESYRVDSFFN